MYLRIYLDNCGFLPESEVLINTRLFELKNIYFITYFIAAMVGKFYLFDSLIPYYSQVSIMGWSRGSKFSEEIDCFFQV